LVTKNHEDVFPCSFDFLFINTCSMFISPAFSVLSRDLDEKHPGPCPLHATGLVRKRPHLQSPKWVLNVFPVQSSKYTKYSSCVQQNQDVNPSFWYASFEFFLLWFSVSIDSLHENFLNLQASRTSGLSEFTGPQWFLQAP
jgi:hypothetical protein